MVRQQGFTLLELIVVVAIIAAALLVGSPVFSGWTEKGGFDNSYKALLSELSSMRNEAFLKNTTTRVNLVSAGSGVYTLTSFAANTPVTTCSAGAATWAQITNQSLNLGDDFVITGSGVGNVCFYRDGTSSGGVYDIEPAEGSDASSEVQLTVTIATGFVDVTE